MSKSSKRQAEQNPVEFHWHDRVRKISGKPFKSDFDVNTIKEFVKNPHTGKNALTFFEDDSIVDAYQCEIADEAF